MAGCFCSLAVALEPVGLATIIPELDGSGALECSRVMRRCLGSQKRVMNQTASSNETPTASSVDARRRLQLWPPFAALCVQVLFICGVYVLAGVYAPAGRLQSADALGGVGEPIEVQVVLDVDRPPVVGRSLAEIEIELVSHDDSPEGVPEPEKARALTDAEGRARWRLSAIGTPGAFGYRARLPGDVKSGHDHGDGSTGFRGQPGSVEVVVGVASVQRPALLVSAEAVVRPGAMAALEQLNENFVIAYLDATQRDLPPLSRRAIREAGFPRGPILRIEGDRAPRDFISKFADRDRSQALWAVCSDRVVAQNLSLAGARIVVIDPKQLATESPPTLYSVTSWDGARRKLDSQRD